MNLLYLTDVFCPWCYGFAPVMRRLAAEHPELPVRVLGGNLMDEPQPLTGMLEEYPTIREFFARLPPANPRNISARPWNRPWPVRARTCSCIPRP